jgi:hypothetical protein
MAFVASRLIKEVTAHAQSDSVEDAQEICADGTYFLNNFRSNTPFRYAAAMRAVTLQSRVNISV